MWYVCGFCFQWSEDSESQVSQKEQGEDGKIEMSLMHFHVSHCTALLWQFAAFDTTVCYAVKL